MHAPYRDTTNARLVLYTTCSSRIFRIPPTPITHEKGIPVADPERVFILTVRRLLEVQRETWTDIQGSAYEGMLARFYGSFIAYPDFPSSAGWTTIADVKREPAVGRSFSGLVRFHDLATPSDLIRNTGLITDQGTVTLTNGSLCADGLVEQLHVCHYLSHPIEHIEEIPQGDIANICRSEIRTREKICRLRRLLP